MGTNTSGTENGIVSKAEPKVVKRAQWEAFEFELEAPGMVRVINGSYEAPEDHAYLVNVEKDVPVACECATFEYGDEPCKHMVAIVIREPVLTASQVREPSKVADGGQTMDVCQNGQSGCDGPDGDDLPCFECFQSCER